MKIRKLLAMVFSIAMALTTVEANVNTQESYADDETTTMIDEIENEPKSGDLIWITDEAVTYWTPDKKFRVDLSTNIEYEIYIIGHYDDEHWRVHVPLINEPERVLLIPVDEYNINVISHDNYVVGDLNRDHRVDAFDLVLLKRELIYGCDFNLDDYSDIEGLMDRSIDRQLSDVNSDSKVSVADVVVLQHWLLGMTKTFRD